MQNRSLIWLAVWLAVLEAVTLFAINVVGYAVRNGSFVLPERYVLAGLFLCALYLICGSNQGSYAFHRSDIERIHAMQSLRCWIGTMVIFIVALFAFKISEDFSRFWLVEMVVGGSVGLVAVRTLALAWVRKVRRNGWFSASIAVLGSPRLVKEETLAMVAGRGGATRLVGGFVGDGLGNDYFQEVPLFGSEESLHRIIAAGRVDDVLLCYEPGHEKAFRAALARLREQPVNIRLQLPGYLAGVPVLGIDRIAGETGIILADVPIGGWSSVQKRFVDIVLGSVMIVALAPVMLAIALAVLLTMGRPIFFRQRRFGFNNDEFTMLKFRTMRNGGTESADAGTLKQATRDDPRVTALGRILRRTSLDELPQLLNVLGGSMSLVGPRPHAVAHNRQYAGIIDGYLGRHRVKPGITGWAQVNGLRGETDTVEKMRRRVELDLFYIENWSLGFDLKILALTVIEVGTGRSAY
ncbi:MAG: undecaprenyl-phosphate glucose phosphotransferase [Nisaea sp.]|uniref:undecaprenyl-phosphate glucose phosphotransferase n=1 Tax=Nisaea sp. TaxID=2024842 RepID=UPI001B11EFBA|nr:undecaprenyl-phosphate glucose phosphotransferase [Nisaea sp.]MBO6560589.1 undecaprenyl-phosphate glucose phosphotransferase [Nisaea sp.]